MLPALADTSDGMVNLLVEIGALDRCFLSDTGPEAQGCWWVLNLSLLRSVGPSHPVSEPPRALTNSLRVPVVGASSFSGLSWKSPSGRLVQVCWFIKLQ